MRVCPSGLETSYRKPPASPSSNAHRNRSSKRGRWLAGRRFAAAAPSTLPGTTPSVADAWQTIPAESTSYRPTRPISDIPPSSGDMRPGPVANRASVPDLVGISGVQLSPPCEPLAMRPCDAPDSPMQAGRSSQIIVRRGYRTLEPRVPSNGERPGTASREPTASGAACLEPLAHSALGQPGPTSATLADAAAAHEDRPG